MQFVHLSMGYRLNVVLGLFDLCDVWGGCGEFVGWLVVSC